MTETATTEASGLDLSHWIECMRKDNAHLVEYASQTGQKNPYYDEGLAGFISDAQRAYNKGRNHEVVEALSKAEHRLVDIDRATRAAKEVQPVEG